MVRFLYRKVIKKRPLVAMDYTPSWHLWTHWIKILKLNSPSRSILWLGSFASGCVTEILLKIMLIEMTSLLLGKVLGFVHMLLKCILMKKHSHMVKPMLLIILLGVLLNVSLIQKLNLCRWRLKLPDRLLMFRLTQLELLKSITLVLCFIILGIVLSWLNIVMISELFSVDFF